MLNHTETCQVQESISRAVARMVRKYPTLRSSAEDIIQDAWVKFLGSYDRGRDLAATLARNVTEGPHKDMPVLAPGAFGYTVATTVALDYARNRKGKLRNHDANVSMDAPVKAKGSDESKTTLADTLADALADASTVMGANDRALAVQAAIAALSDAQRDAIEAWLDDRTMTGGQRIAKMRAIEQIQESVSARL